MRHVADDGLAARVDRDVLDVLTVAGVTGLVETDFFSCKDQGRRWPKPPASLTRQLYVPL